MDAADPPRGKLDPDMCFACSGTGYCARCKGNGRYIPRGMQAIVACSDCAGSGECPECDGSGRVLPEAEDD